MSDGTTVFGTPAMEDGEGELFPEAAETAPETEATEEPEPVAEVTETEVEVTEEAQPEAPEEPEPEQPQFYAGTYKTKEDTEAGINHLRTFATEQAQRAAQIEREHKAMLEGLRKYEPLLRQMAEQETTQPLPDMEPDEQAALQQFIKHQVEAGIQRAVKPLQDQRTEEQQQRALREIQEFRAAHPEALGRDTEISAVVSAYRYDDDGAEIFPPTKQNLEIAWELASNPSIHQVLQTLNLHPDPEYVEVAKEVASQPALAKVVFAHPHVVDSDAGMAWAREQAQVPQVVTSATANATTQQQTELEDERKRAYVEKGEGRSEVDTAPGRKPVDPLEEALNDRLSQGEKSVFGI